MKKVFVLTIIFLNLLPLMAQEKKEELLLEAVGALSGQNMYLTYMALGNVADSYASGLYKVEFAAQMADELNEMIGMTVKQYNDMLNSKLLVDEDYNAILKFVDVYTALGEEAAGLKAMIVQNNEENIGMFERGRQKSWKFISEILGIPGN